MSPTTVATSTINYSISYGYMRKSFHAAGLFWVFYSDGTNAYFKTSNNGINWSDPTSIGACTAGSLFSVWFDPPTGFVHYARQDNYDLFYRRGAPQTNGTISWSAVEQTVYDGVSGDLYRAPCISVDTSGYAWIGVRRDHPGGDDFPVVLKNANLDGTWAEDFAYRLNYTYDDVTWVVCPIPLTDGKVYVFYPRCKQTMFGRLYDETWGAQESTMADYDPTDQWTFCAVAEGDDIHFIYNRNTTTQIRYNKRTFGVGWGAADVLVHTPVSIWVSPALSIDTINHELYCFWSDIDTDHVYYKKYSSGSWSDLLDWIDESVDEIAHIDMMSSYYKDYNGCVMALYVTKLASPYNIRADYLSCIPAPTVTTQNATGIGLGDPP